MKKVCNNCKEEKKVSEFYKKKRKNYYSYSSECKECIKEKRKEYYQENTDSIKEKRKEYYQENTDNIKEKTKQYKRDNKEYYQYKAKDYREKNGDKLNDYSRKYREENKESIKEQRKEYYEKNKEEIIRKNYEYIKNKRETDTLFKLKHNIGSLIRVSFNRKNIKKAMKTTEILGCSIKEFREYLENQFDKNMNWENHGTYWELDHIKPISLAITEEEIYELNHYTNFQPLYWEDNLSKSNKF